MLFNTIKPYCNVVKNEFGWYNGTFNIKGYLVEQLGCDMSSEEVEKLLTKRYHLSNLYIVKQGIVKLRKVYKNSTSVYSIFLRLVAVIEELQKTTPSNTKTVLKEIREDKTVSQGETSNILEDFNLEEVKQYLDYQSTPKVVVTVHIKDYLDKYYPNADLDIVYGIIYSLKNNYKRCLLEKQDDVIKYKFYDSVVESSIEKVAIDMQTLLIDLEIISNPYVHISKVTGGFSVGIAIEEFIRDKLKLPQLPTTIFSDDYVVAYLKRKALQSRLTTLHVNRAPYTRPIETSKYTYKRISHRLCTKIKHFLDLCIQDFNTELFTVETLSNKIKDRSAANSILHFKLVPEGILVYIDLLAYLKQKVKPDVSLEEAIRYTKKCSTDTVQIRSFLYGYKKVYITKTKLDDIADSLNQMFACFSKSE